MSVEVGLVVLNAGTRERLDALGSWNVLKGKDGWTVVLTRADGEVWCAGSRVSVKDIVRRLERRAGIPKEPTQTFRDGHIFPEDANV